MDPAFSPAVVEVMQGYAWHAGPVLFAMHGRGWMRLDGWILFQASKIREKPHDRRWELNNSLSHFLI